MVGSRLGSGDPIKEHRERERGNHGMLFEACRHFTTLDTAAALIVVAIFRETEAGIVEVVWPLVCFLISLIVCAYGMIVTALRGLGNFRAARSTSYALIGGASAFFLGLVWAVAKALPG